MSRADRSGGYSPRDEQDVHNSDQHRPACTPRDQQRSGGGRGDHTAQRYLTIGDIPRKDPMSIQSLTLIRREKRSNSAQRFLSIITGRRKGRPESLFSSLLITG